MRGVEELKQLFAEQFQLDAQQIRSELTFAELAIDSLEWMELTVAIEDAFGIQLDEAALARCHNLGEAAQLILRTDKEENR